MSVFDLTVIMHKIRQVIMSVFVIQKKNHKMRQVIMSVFVMQKRITKCDINTYCLLSCKLRVFKITYIYLHIQKSTGLKYSKAKERKLEELGKKQFFTSPEK